MEELSGKVAVVTGAASGIGFAMARAFAAEGMKVVLADIEEPALKRATQNFEAGAVRAVPTDVSVPEQVDALRDAALDRFGAVHVICNNAGVGAGGQSWDLSLHDWRWVLGANLWGVIHGVRSFVPTLLEQGEGHVVNTASMAGVTSPPFMGPYNVSKHGVVTLSETLYAELGMQNAGVGVSVLCPGWVKTGIAESDRNRPPDPAEVELAGDAAAPALEMRQLMKGVIDSGLEPSDVAQLVVDAVRENRFWVFAHPDWTPMIRNRMTSMVEGTNPGVNFFNT